MLWTTKYLDAAVTQLRAAGHEIRDEHIGRGAGQGRTLPELKPGASGPLERVPFTPSRAPRPHSGDDHRPPGRLPPHSRSYARP
nr:hypothetical protein [Streptomyces sp. NRRL F-2747]